MPTATAPSPRASGWRWDQYPYPSAIKARGIRIATAVCPIKNPPPTEATTATAVVSPSQPKQATGATNDASAGNLLRTAVSHMVIGSSLTIPGVLLPATDGMIASL